MPHSPRLHEGRLWLLDSGNGYLCRVEPGRGEVERVAFCPGHLRGLCFLDEFAVAGLSEPRAGTFSGLALDDELARRNAGPRCGLMVIDLRTGDVVHWLRFEGVVSELYDVAVLPGAARPMALGFRTGEIERTITVDDPWDATRAAGG